ncbi:MAG: alkaline phosphatase family protein [Clostridia bacterium]|nr:alkaline phosphatase family protein [Clostridia bacterium]
MYVAPIDETITLFLDTEKGKDKVVSEKFLNVKEKLVQRTIVDEINENTEYSAIELFPFGENKYNSFDEMLEIIEKECNKKGKKYIYAYDNEPDHTMHDFGPDDERVKELIEIRNNKVEQLCNNLNDSIVIVVADHGHKEVEHIYLKDYPNVMEMLERTTSLEQRAISFKIKEGYREQFIKEFNGNFGKYFKLYSKSEIIESHLFGYGEENELFREAIGDFIAIAENSNKCIITDGDDILRSQHAGYTDDEIYVPLIVIDI